MLLSQIKAEVPFSSASDLDMKEIRDLAEIKKQKLKKYCPYPNLKKFWSAEMKNQDL